MTAPRTDPPSVVWAWARVLGALQETQRLGHTRVEVGHLLLTVYGDPFVRVVLVRSGLDLRDVQRRVGELPAAEDILLITNRTSAPPVTDIAPEAADVLERLGRAQVPSSGGIATGPTAPGPSFAAIYRSLAVLLLDADGPAAIEELLGDLVPAATRHRIAERLHA